MIAQIVAHQLHFSPGDGIQPAHQGLIVVGAGVGNAVLPIIMGQIIAGRASIPGVEGKLEHLHVREAAFLHHFADGIGHVAQILGDHFRISQLFPDRTEQVHPGTLFPPAVHGGILAVRDGVIGVKAAEVVNAGHVVELEAVPQAGAPPLIAGRLVIIPTVERIAPELTGGREAIRRAARNSNRLILLVQLEKLRIGPCIGAVHRHIDRDIAHDADALLVGISPELLILLEELELHVQLEFDIKV